MAGKLTKFEISVTSKGEFKVKVFRKGHKRTDSTGPYDITNVKSLLNFVKNTCINEGVGND